MKVTEPKVAIVVAMAKANRVIGHDNDLPWRLPGDMKHFKAVTMGKPIIMGRKTYESIGKPLPGRTNIVVTRNDHWQADGVSVFRNIEDAIAAAKLIATKDGADEVSIIGGAEIYTQALDYTDVIHLTEVAGEVAGDTLFPALDADAWVVTERRKFDDHPDATHKAEYVRLERR